MHSKDHLLQSCRLDDANYHVKNCFCQLSLDDVCTCAGEGNIVSNFVRNCLPYSKLTEREFTMSQCSAIGILTQNVAKLSLEVAQISVELV